MCVCVSLPLRSLNLTAWVSLTHTYHPNNNRSVDEGRISSEFMKAPESRSNKHVFSHSNCHYHHRHHITNISGITDSLSNLTIYSMGGGVILQDVCAFFFPHLHCRVPIIFSGPTRFFFLFFSSFCVCS